MSSVESLRGLTKLEERVKQEFSFSPGEEIFISSKIIRRRLEQSGLIFFPQGPKLNLLHISTRYTSVAAILKPFHNILGTRDVLLVDHYELLNDG